MADAHEVRHILCCAYCNAFAEYLQTYTCGTRWYKNERLQKSEDFRRNAVGTTQMIQSGHMMACWKAKSLNYDDKIL